MGHGVSELILDCNLGLLWLIVSQKSSPVGPRLSHGPRWPFGANRRMRLLDLQGARVEKLPKTSSYHDTYPIIIIYIIIILYIYIISYIYIIYIYISYIYIYIIYIYIYHIYYFVYIYILYIIYRIYIYMYILHSIYAKRVDTSDSEGLPPAAVSEQHQALCAGEC